MTDAPHQKDVFEPLHGNRFRFRCHKDMECFTRCCAGLNLVLMPYDILRMKRRLPQRRFSTLTRRCVLTDTPGSPWWRSR